MLYCTHSHTCRYQKGLLYLILLCLKHLDTCIVRLLWPLTIFCAMTDFQKSSIIVKTILWALFSKTTFGSQLGEKLTRLNQLSNRELELNLFAAQLEQTLPVGAECLPGIAHICPQHRLLQHWPPSPINPPVNIDGLPPFCGAAEKSADFIPRPFIFDPSIDREQSGRLAKAAVAQLQICAQLLIAAKPKTLKKLT